MNFNEKDYVNGKKIHKDPFEENGFNRKASDDLSSDRSIPDTRHARYEIVYNGMWQLAIELCKVLN